MKLVFSRKFGSSDLGSWLKRSGWTAGMLGPMLLAGGSLRAQTCTTQARLAPDVRSALADAAGGYAAAVKANNTTKLKAAAIAEYASNFGASSVLINNTAERLSGDTLKVAQIYELDARSRKADDPSDADFSCPLAGTAQETDFAISGLPPGLYGFVMVEANGDRPWLLSFLLRQEGAVWKLAGFYPHARAAAGHDGLWFWTSARDDAKAKQLWFSWLLYGEADALLRPANFATSTNLDKLRAEQRNATPPELANGIGPDVPLVVKGAAVAATATTPAVAAKEFRFTGINSEGSEDGKRLNLVLHLRADDAAADAPSQMASNADAAKAFLNAHKELKQGFDGVIVIAERPGSSPFVTEQKIAELQ